jgi:hypothetical protein
LRVRRQGRSLTPDWIQVPDEEMHQFAKLSYFDNCYHALEENRLRRYRVTTPEPDEKRMVDTLCDCGMSRQHTRRECRRRFVDDDDTVLMGKLFSFMS